MLSFYFFAVSGVVLQLLQQGNCWDLIREVCCGGWWCRPRRSLGWVPGV